MKVSELFGARLDAAVAMAEGLPYEICDGGVNCMVQGRAEWIETRQPRRSGAPFFPGDEFEELFWPSSSWEHGGPLIERECINIMTVDGGETWIAGLNGVVQEGEDPLIAAMRAYVASKFGETLDFSIP